MRNYFKTSFRRELLLCFLGVAILPMFVCSMFLVQTFQYKIQNDYAKDAFYQLELMEQSLVERIDLLEGVANELVQSKKIQQDLYVKETEQKQGVYWELYAKTNKYLDYAQFSLFSVGGICKYSTQSEFVGKQLPTYW